jgi:hypothetical protein
MRFKPQAHTVARRAGEELILVNLTTNRMFSANDSGSRIWDAIARGEDIDGLASALTESADTNTVADDVEAFVDLLLREALIERA